MTEERQTKKYTIHGWVQGVGFRWFTRQAAEAVGVSGWVRNMPDGTVEVVASGAPGDLETFERRIHEGPASARVERIEEQTAADSEAGDKFEIRR